MTIEIERPPCRPKRVKLPEWLNPRPWMDLAREATLARAEAALRREAPDVSDFAALLAPAAAPLLERMAVRAQELTRRHFGRTINLYAPLYLADHCSSGCVYCGFSSDRKRPRQVLGPESLKRELQSLKQMGLDEVLLLTGDRHREADFAYLEDSVRVAAALFDTVAVESFTMTRDEYRRLTLAGCTGVTLYQETYDTVEYYRLHRWGPKVHYEKRLHGPELALEAGVRTMGIGVLLGLCEPIYDVLSLFRHAAYLRKRFWQAGVTLSFPRMRHQLGDYEPRYAVDDATFARIICAFRICLPDVPLVLSTRESAPFRDGMAGIGITKMSVASKTTVGGYAEEQDPAYGQFDISDNRDVATFCAALRAKNLEPVFKNWDAMYRETGAARQFSGA